MTLDEAIAELTAKLHPKESAWLTIRAVCGNGEAAGIAGTVEVQCGPLVDEFDFRGTDFEPAVRAAIDRANGWRVARAAGEDLTEFEGPRIPF